MLYRSLKLRRFMCATFLKSSKTLGFMSRLTRLVFCSGAFGFFMPCVYSVSSVFPVSVVCGVFCASSVYSVLAVSSVCCAGCVSPVFCVSCVYDVSGSGCALLINAVAGLISLKFFFAMVTSPLFGLAGIRLSSPDNPVPGCWLARRCRVARVVPVPL